MNRNERELAKRVIAEIVRQSPGDELAGKTKLFQTFYFAHLFYANDNSGYLTEWPIVKLPCGPGVDQFDDLMRDLVAAGVVETEPTRIGPYKATIYRATERDCQPLLSHEAIDAIRKAVEFVNDNTATELSQLTHDYSRSWNEADLGDELSVYKDILSDEEYELARARADRIESELDAAWSEPSRRDRELAAALSE
jgi:tetrahydromethanopterin S-methyltransferase subunit G